MPNCFSLTRKSDPAAGPVPLALIDDEMCEHFGVTPHPKDYYKFWYTFVGLPLACGKTLADVQGMYKDNPEGLAIVEWLDANFTSEAWAEIGRR